MKCLHRGWNEKEKEGFSVSDNFRYSQGNNNFILPCGILLCDQCECMSLQCFNTVGWATGRESGL